MFDDRRAKRLTRACDEFVVSSRIGNYLAELRIRFDSEEAAGEGSCHEKTMSALQKPESRLLVFVILALTAGCAVALRSGQPSPPPQRNNESTDGRRSFLTKALASASVSLVRPQSAQAISFPGRSFFGQSNEVERPPQDRPEILYTEFKDMLESRELDSVEFGFDGRSIVALDRRGVSHKVDQLPDDPKLLQILYDRDVSVSVKAFNFPKQTNTVNWFRDLVGDDLTPEELYKYRGYMTVRTNVPENNYVPANLITGLDYSRAAYNGAGEKVKPKSFVDDLKFFVKNGNKGNEEK